MRILKTLFYFIAIFGMFLILGSCRTKSVQIFKGKEKISERKENRKDSISEVKNESKTAEISFENQQSFEMEIISDKEKDSVIYERIRSPTSEKIIVRGGSLKLRTTTHTADKITKKDTIRVNNTSVRTNIEEVRSTDKQIFKKEENKKNTGFSFKAYFWLILILILLFLAWRLKLFKL